MEKAWGAAAATTTTEKSFLCWRGWGKRKEFTLHFDILFLAFIFLCFPPSIVQVSFVFLPLSPKCRLYERSCCFHGGWGKSLGRPKVFKLLRHRSFFVRSEKVLNWNCSTPWLCCFSSFPSKTIANPASIINFSGNKKVLKEVVCFI